LRRARGGTEAGKCNGAAARTQPGLASGQLIVGFPPLDQFILVARRIDLQRKLLTVEFGEPRGPRARAQPVVLAGMVVLAAAVEAQLELCPRLPEAVAHPRNGGNS